jgi:iron(III) transport system ATP-binding protein
MPPLLEVKDIQVCYQGKAVVDKLSMHVNKGTLACLLGPSGCGKTTALRAIAGFEAVDQGSIHINGKALSRPGFSLPPEQRRIGMVFQDYALFPHMTVSKNICFGLRGYSKAEKKKTADQLLETVGMERMGHRYPHELSGGQQQRVALARALAPQPELILMDEPFSNLDVELRERLSFEVRDILKHHKITGILVTHDQNEAFAIGEQVGVMRDGKILQWDTPYNLYHEPIDRFVADFIGQGVLLEGTMVAPDTVETEVGIIKGNRAYHWPNGTKVDLLLRPDDIVPAANSSLKGKIINKAFKGAEVLYTLSLPMGSKVLTLFPSHLNHEIGEQVGIRIEAEHVVAFGQQEESNRL